MSPWTTRHVTTADTDAFMTACEQVWGTRYDPAGHAELDTMLRDDTVFVASRADRPDARIDGTFVHFVGGLSFPGGPNTDADFITWVGVRPDARRRGALSAMMRHHWHDAAERGAAWAVLWASEPGIYGRFGYGVASHQAKTTISSGALEKAAEPHLDGTDFELRPVDEEGVAIVHDLWEQYGRQRIGVPQWRSHARTIASNAAGHESSTDLPPTLAIVTRDGIPTAAASVVREAKWENGSPAGTAGTDVVVSTSVRDRIVLAHHLTSFDLFVSTRFNFISANDPIVWAAGGPKQASVTLQDGLWVRPLHTDKALASRTYVGPLDVVIEVSDPIPGTASTMRLVVAPDGVATCEPCDDAPDVTVDSATIGALSLGAWPVEAIAGRVAAGQLKAVDHTPGTLAQLTRAARTDNIIDNVVSF